MTDVETITDQPTTDRSRPRPRRRLLVGGAIAIAVLASAGGSWAFVNSQLSPSARVQEFLRHLTDNDVEAALAALDRLPSNRLLLNPAVYSKASDHITSFTIGETIVSGERATVTATVTQAGEEVEREFTLSRFQSGIFSDWRIDLNNLARVELHKGAPADSALTVNGTVVGDDVLSAPALPGSYTFEMTSNSELVTTEKRVAKVTFERSRSRVILTMAAELTDEGKARAIALIQEHFAACVAQPVMSAPGCAYEITPLPGETLSNFAWSVKTAPTYTVKPWDQRGFPVSAVTAGWVRLDAHYVNATDEGDFWSEFPDVYPEGWVTFDKSGEPVFTSIFK